jgi:hypothetical protein
MGWILYSYYLFAVVGQLGREEMAFRAVQAKN